MEEKEIRRRPRRISPVVANRRVQGMLIAALLAVFVLLFSVIGLCAKDREFSESENRSLAQAPALTWGAIKDGSFFSDLSAYVADQFPGRDGWMGVNLWVNKTLGAKEASGVYLCADNYLIQIPGMPNAVQHERNLKAMEAFAQAHKDINMVAAIVPNAATVLADKLPKNAPVRDQMADLAAIDQALTQVTFVDTTQKLLEHNTEALYYRTDHHWTTLAAGYAFEAIAPKLGINPPATDRYERYVVSTTFEGTLSSKAGSHKALDTVEIVVPPTNIQYYVNYPDTNEEVCSLYAPEALDAKDHYTVFFGGNYGRLDITTSADTGKSLLILKDSYANCMVQYLYPYFDHITMVDPRYYYDNLENVITSEGITDVLYLYNLDTFLSDASLADALAVGA